MSLISRTRALWRGLSRRPRFEADMEAELRFHVDAFADDLIVRGVPAEEARRRARIEFGSPEAKKEDCRASLGLRTWDELRADVRYGARALLKTPAFTVVAAVTLTLGIGAGAAIFSLVSGILLRPLPYADPDRLVNVWTPVPAGGFVALRQQSRTMDVAACGYYGVGGGYNLTSSGQTTRVVGVPISGNLFRVLGVPLRGAGPSVAQESAAEPVGIVISNRLWRERFSADPKVVGESAVIDGAPAVVTAVAPIGFDYPSPGIDVWVTRKLSTSDKDSLWSGEWMGPVARLKPDATVTQARAELKALAPGIVAGFPWKMPEHWGEWGTVESLHEYTVGDARNKLLILLAAVGLMVLTACANIANLMLARATSRQRDLAVRAALGARRSRLIRQMLVESLLLATAAGLAGAWLAWGALPALKGILPITTPRLHAVSVDWRMLTFTAALSVTTVVLFGLWPALRASRIDIEQALRSSSLSAGEGRHRRAFSSALVVVQTAIVVVLVTGAGLLIKSLWTLANQPSGLEPAGVVTARITPSTVFCRDQARCEAFYASALEKVRGTAGVESAGTTTTLPYSFMMATVLAVHDKPQWSAEHPFQTWAFEVSPGYLRTMGIPLQRGRDFTADDKAGAPGVVIVSRKLADSLWPGEEPIGKQVRPSWMRGEWRTVVGVAADIREYAVASGAWAAGTVGDVYYPAAQGMVMPSTNRMIAVKASGDPQAAAGAIRAAVAAVNREVPVSNVATMPQVMSESLAGPRSSAILFGLFATIALLLGVIGLYGLVNYGVAQRTREIAIRMAVGARRLDVVNMVVRQGVRLAALGTLTGVAVALAASGLIRGLLYGIAPNDPAIYVAVVALLAAAAVLASYLPARRAARVDPMVALRQD